MAERERTEDFELVTPDSVRADDRPARPVPSRRSMAVVATGTLAVLALAAGVAAVTQGQSTHKVAVPVLVVETILLTADLGAVECHEVETGIATCAVLVAGSDGEESVLVELVVEGEHSR